MTLTLENFKYFEEKKTETMSTIQDYWCETISTGGKTTEIFN